MSSWIDLGKLAARESAQVEWKENVASVDDVVKTIAAFANDWSNLGGGYVVCGAREERDEHGFQKMSTPGLSAARFKEVEGRVIAACHRFVDPPIVPQVEELPAEEPGRRILVFVVPATDYAHTFRTPRDSGKYYVRIDRSTREARNSLLRELLVRKRQLEPWDRRCDPEADLKEIDLIAFRDTLQRMKLWDPERDLADYFSPKARLSPFVPPLCREEPLSGKLRPRNFTVLLFGRDVQRFFPGAYCIFSRYPGTDRSEPHAERRMLTGNLLEQTRQLLEQLGAEAHEIIDKTSETPNKVNYPLRALEESFINAAVHRDYESDQPIRVTAFSNRIEFFSPGSLLSAVDPERFLAGEPAPVWRNQALAWFFNKLDLAQAEGQGIATILRTMRDAGCPPPSFEITPENLLCTIPAHPPPMAVRSPAESPPPVQRFVPSLVQVWARSFRRVISEKPVLSGFAAMVLLVGFLFLGIYRLGVRTHEARESFLNMAGTLDYPAVELLRAGTRVVSTLPVKGILALSQGEGNVFTSAVILLGMTLGWIWLGSARHRPAVLILSALLVSGLALMIGSGFYWFAVDPGTPPRLSGNLSDRVAFETTSWLRNDSPRNDIRREALNGLILWLLLAAAAAIWAGVRARGLKPRSSRLRWVLVGIHLLLLGFLLEEVPWAHAFGAWGLKYPQVLDTACDAEIAAALKSGRCRAYDVSAGARDQMLLFVGVDCPLGPYYQFRLFSQDCELGLGAEEVIGAWLGGSAGLARRIDLPGPSLLR